MVVRTDTVDVPNGFALNKKVQCANGEHATGGGVSDPSTNANSRITQSAPIVSNGDLATAGQQTTGWWGSVFNGSSGSMTYTVYADCVK